MQQININEVNQMNAEAVNEKQEVLTQDELDQIFGLSETTDTVAVYNDYGWDIIANSDK